MGWKLLAVMSIVGMFLLPSGMGFAGEIQDLADEIWNDTKKPPGGNCMKFIVQAGPPPVLRGKVSGRGCVQHAIKAYREGDHEEAFGWILAGKCRDREARLTLVQQAPRVMEYVMEKYGPQVPE